GYSHTCTHLLSIPTRRSSDLTQKAGVSDPDGRYGLGVVWTDVDGDGWQDLYVANDSGPSFLYHNKHDSTFEEMGYLAGCAVGEEDRKSTRLNSSHVAISYAVY